MVASVRGGLSVEPVRHVAGVRTEDEADGGRLTETRSPAGQVTRRTLMTVAATGQKTVLVIEDDPWTRTITTALLAGEGFAVVEAKNGEEGLHFAAQHSPDVVLLDLALPTKSGLEVLRELKGSLSTSGIP